jgi:hypothetical protein
LRREPEHFRARDKRQYYTCSPVDWHHRLKREHDNQEIRAFTGKPE